MNNKFIIALYDDEEVLLAAVRKIRQKGIKIYDVLTPFPVHGLEAAMGLKDSRLHTVGFIAGLCGCIFAFSFMTWVFTSNYPINFGGKPYFSWPSFIPITFEFTVLSASITMTIAFLARCGLYPGKKNRIFDERITDDMFAMTFAVDNATEEEIEKISAALEETGVKEIKKKDFTEEE
jgi:hypothetical protein